MNLDNYPKKQGLYDPQNEHDACGIGAIISINGIKSHKIINDGLEILKNLKHRGGTGAEDNTGDGAGIIVQLPHEFFASQDLGFSLSEGNYGVAQIFTSRNKERRDEVLKIFEETLKEENISLLGYRDVPIYSIEIGKSALDAMPYIMQAFVERPKNVCEGIDFERKLYTTRRIVEKKCLACGKNNLYFCSFSSKTIVYKGMLLATQVKNFYLDLKNILFKSSIVLVHSRFSTNTFPSWERAHPNRFIVHNGEINTIRGNVDSVKARETHIKSHTLDLEKVLPIIAKPSSDSAMFDNTLEFLYYNGRTLAEILMMMIPEPWTKDKVMSEEKKNFYEYNSMLMEPWDGPAAVISTDGDVVVASLDRNGLRPSRYYLTNDDMLILASETGSFEYDESNIKLKSRLEAGKLLLIDTKQKRLISDEEIKLNYAKQKPYGEWLKNTVKLENVEIVECEEQHYSTPELLIRQTSYGYNYDTIEQGIIPMANNGEEAIVAMGHDTPLAVLSKRVQPLYNYFKQLFAQVTNPPIDSIREESVTSTRIYAGKEGDLLNPDEKNAKRLKIPQSIISNNDLRKIKSLEQPELKSKTINILFETNESLSVAIDRIFEEVRKAIAEGITIIILSDRLIDNKHIAIPALLATSAIHTYLVNEGLRTNVSLIVESGEPREIHHYACLIGLGATAINPYLVYESIYDLVEKSVIKKTYEDACHSYDKAATKGIVKIISKMGISTVQAYNGACIFEAIGLSNKLVDKYFTGISSKIQGITIEDIETQSRNLHEKAFNELLVALDSEGTHKMRNNREEHLYNPFTIVKLQQACRNNDYSLFQEFTQDIDNRKNNLRNILDFKLGHEISIDDVESVESIVKRFKSGAMSYGSISEEAHECIAIAMNRIGAKSNTGEGGELPERYEKLENGDSKTSAIVQVASGRFGVTMEYLVKAKEIQIKVAQGAKPGEGGQLPGTKVYPWVARARHSTPGVTLISPPPHHDIYSIEDLDQLIYDLKSANRDVRISVKLVSENGIGTVASGVAKAGANVILISGYDGGTGASPRTSISNAGMPWEIGLADAHQTLVLNNLRGRVSLEVDGKLMTGRDLAIAALLGADEFGFATAPLIAIGCVMMRVCNLDTCPVGVATQNTELRKRFKGKPEYVVNFMRFIATQLREYMALLGFKTLDEMIGRTDLLKMKENTNIDLSSIISNPIVLNKTHESFRQKKEVDFTKSVDVSLLLPLCKKAIEEKKKVNIDLKITNTDRTFGTILSSEIVKKYGSIGLPANTININAHGNAGNSFGAFLTNGVTITVNGDANDYVGKGLCGGEIVIKLSEKSSLDPTKNIIAGNVALYGATAGKIFIDGIAGDRFGVRNSGATAVVLGVGQHGCEYMVGGKVLILGKIGRNFAAGMSGGVAYVSANEENLANINKGIIDIMELDEKDAVTVKELLQEHHQKTNSRVSGNLLKDFSAKDYYKVMPKDYYRITKIKEQLMQTMGEEEATLKSFYQAMEVR